MYAISTTKKFITTDELKAMGYSYYKIKQLEADGLISRANKSTYENLSYNGDENDFLSAKAFVPSGVICLMSAARYYGLTTFLPDTVDVAIERKQKVSTLPDWPAIKLYYFDRVRMEAGVTEINECNETFRIFDVEKTVVDIISYRNKLGIEETAEILRNYVKRKDRQIDKLYNYSKLLRCEKIVRTYLEVLLH
jgi:predicted transcriptional regulator of viral defense system